MINVYFYIFEFYVQIIDFQLFITIIQKNQK